MTQKQKVLNALRKANGDWVNGRHFLHNLFLSQFHTRIHELQKEGYVIEASNFTDEHGFKSYRLIREKDEVVVLTRRPEKVEENQLALFG
jgi:hypothetical protein